MIINVHVPIIMIKLKKLLDHVAHPVLPRPTHASSMQVSCVDKSQVRLMHHVIMRQ